MANMLGTFALIMYLLTTLGTQMLFAVFAEDSLHLVGSLLALLADELDFVLVGGVTRVTLSAAHLLALEAPQCAFGFLVAFLAFYCHGDATPGFDAQLLY